MQTRMQSHRCSPLGGLGKAQDGCGYSKKPLLTSEDHGHCKRMDPLPLPGSHIHSRSKASETSPQQDPDRTENLQPTGDAQLGEYKEQLSPGEPNLHLRQTQSAGARFKKVFVSMVKMERMFGEVWPNGRAEAYQILPR
ncbi:hypothetical protein Q9966_005095 [Columba livia]|nr:hypothetical protein Q9966_005095 [Columba livia]